MKQSGWRLTWQLHVYCPALPISVSEQQLICSCWQDFGQLLPHAASRMKDLDGQPLPLRTWVKKPWPGERPRGEGGGGRFVYTMRCRAEEQILQ